MKISDIIALTNAGWSKQEIMKMAGIESNPTPAGTQQPVNMPPVNPPAGKPEPVKMPTVTLLTGNPPPVNPPAVNPPAGNPTPAGNAEENETLSLLRNLTQMMQKNNINNMQNQTQEQPDAAELLAKILD